MLRPRLRFVVNQNSSAAPKACVEESRMNGQNLWFWILIVLSLAILALIFVTLHKVRKIHIATYPLLANASATRKETEALFGQLQALLALDRKLDLPQELPPMRGWAASPDFLLVVANEILRLQPACVLECGSGVSSIVIARCLQINGNGHAYSLEHDLCYAEKTRKLLDDRGLGGLATVLHAPLGTRRTSTPWYAEDGIPADLDAIEVLIVDGPPSKTAPLARHPALPQMFNRMSPNGIIIMDDANREDEMAIVRRWKSDYPIASEQRPACEKGCSILQLSKRPATST